MQILFQIPFFFSIWICIVFTWMTAFPTLVLEVFGFYQKFFQKFLNQFSSLLPLHYGECEIRMTEAWYKFSWTGFFFQMKVFCIIVCFSVSLHFQFHLGIFLKDRSWNSDVWFLVALYCLLLFSLWLFISSLLSLNQPFFSFWLFLLIFLFILLLFLLCHRWRTLSMLFWSWKFF